MLSFIYIPHTSNYAFLSWNVIVILDMTLYFILFYSEPIDPFGNSKLNEYFKNTITKNIKSAKQERENIEIKKRKKLQDKANKLETQTHKKQKSSANFFKNLFSNKSNNKKVFTFS